jgi:hypothetical protein
MANCWTGSYDNLWDVAAQHPDSLPIQSQTSEPETRTDSIAGWPIQQAAPQPLVCDPDSVEKVFAALGDELDDTVENQNS